MAKDAEQLLQDLASADLEAVRQGKAEERARPSGRTNVLTVRKNLRKFLQAYGPATLDVIVKDFIRDQSGRYRFYNG